MALTPTGLAMLTQAQLDYWAEEVRTQIQGGQLPDYIPMLAQADLAWFAVQIQGINSQIYPAGDLSLLFPLMSVVKPFVLLYLLEQLGAEVVFCHMGMEPSGAPFNSLEQLQADRGYPRNPMINSGAIALCSLLPGNDAATRCDRLRQWLNQRAGCQLALDEQMLDSVRADGGERNRAIARYMAESGYLEAESIALDTYNHVCCLAGTVADLAQLGMLLVQGSSTVPAHRRIVNALLTTCGLYEASGRFAVEVGLPTKSGVSGAMLSVVPQQGAIACYSPPLDRDGNSIAGLLLLRQLASALSLSVFG